MKNTKISDYILVFLVLVMCLCIPLADATVYYHDNTTGNNSDDGLSPTNAWKTADAHNSKGDLGEDNTFLFNGGQEFGGRFALNDNGMRISSYGTGQAILKDGIYSSDLAVEHTDGAIYNLAFSMTSSNYPIYLRGGSGYSIYDNTIDCNHNGASYNGINVNISETYDLPSHDNLIYDNVIFDCYGGIFLNGGSYDNQVYRNTISTYGDTDEDAILTGDGLFGGNLAYDNIIYDNSIYCSGAGGIDDGEDTNSNGINIGYNSKNILVYDNSIYGSCTSGVQLDRGNVDDNYVYNNIIVNSVSGLRVWTYGTEASNNGHFLNNTIIAGARSVYGMWLRCGSGATVGTCIREGIEIKNNIFTFIDATHAIFIDVGDAGDSYIPDINNNVYYNIGTSSDVFRAKLDTTTYTTLATWKAALLALDPTIPADAASMLANASLGDDHLDADYKPESDFPGINEGLSFDSIFTTDYDGYIRAGLWDIGAYEFHQGTSPGNRMTFKRVTIN